MDHKESKQALSHSSPKWTRYVQPSSSTSSRSSIQSWDQTQGETYGSRADERPSESLTPLGSTGPTGSRSSSLYSGSLSVSSCESLESSDRDLVRVERRAILASPFVSQPHPRPRGSRRLLSPSKGQAPLPRAKHSATGQTEARLGPVGPSQAITRSLSLAAQIIDLRAFRQYGLVYRTELPTTQDVRPTAPAAPLRLWRFDDQARGERANVSYKSATETLDGYYPK